MYVRARIESLTNRLEPFGEEVAAGAAFLCLLKFAQILDMRVG